MSGLRGDRETWGLSLKWKCLLFFLFKREISGSSGSDIVYVGGADPTS